MAMRIYSSEVGKLVLQSIGQYVKIEHKGYTYHGVIKNFIIGPQGYFITIDQYQVGPLPANQEIKILTPQS